MPVKVTLYDQAPILIATFTGFVNVEAVKEMYQQSLPLMATLTPPYYRISDVTNAYPDAEELFKITTYAANHQSAFDGDPNVTAVFVGNYPMVKLASETLRNIFNIELPPFATLDEAIAYLCGKINRLDD